MHNVVLEPQPSQYVAELSEPLLWHVLPHDGYAEREDELLEDLITIQVPSVQDVLDDGR